MGVVLTNVKGVGGSASRKLKRAGIETIEELAELDLRKKEVDGLSTENLAQLRDNASRFLQAQRTGDLSLVEGLGPSARKKLFEAGVKDIHALAELDLRKQTVNGLSTNHLQKLKRNARYLLP